MYMKQIIKHVAKAVAIGKTFTYTASRTENAEGNAVRHGLARRTKIFSKIF